MCPSSIEVGSIGEWSAPSSLGQYEGAYRYIEDVIYSGGTGVSNEVKW